MTIKPVQCYRLWPDETWDLVTVFVESEPWNAEIVEARAVKQAWCSNFVLTLPTEKKPRQIGLFMPSFQEASIDP